MADKNVSIKFKSGTKEAKKNIDNLTSSLNKLGKDAKNDSVSKLGDAWKRTSNTIKGAGLGAVIAGEVKLLKKELQAIKDTAEAFNVQLKAEKLFIMKARPIILPTPLSYSSCMNVHNWGFFEKGTTIMKVSYPNNNFRFGDVCPLTVFVDNTRGELDVTEVKVSLVRLVTMKKIAKANQYPFKHSIFEQTFELKVKSKSSFQCSFAFQINDPYTAPHYFMSYNPYEHITDFKQFLPTVDALTISCQYFLVVSCYFNSFVTEGYRPTVNMPITITHQLLNEYKAGENEDADLQKAIAESKEEINNVPLTHEDYGDYTIINKEVPIPINNNNIPNNGPYPNEDNEPPIVVYPHVNDYGPYPILDNEPPHQVEEEQKKEPAPTFVDINEI